MRRRLVERKLSFVVAIALLVLALADSHAANDGGSADATPAKGENNAPAPVKVEKSAPTVERRVFLPSNPSGPHPKLAPGEKAATEFAYKLGCSIIDADVTNQEERCGRWFVRFRPKEFVVRLSLPIVIWTPQGAPQKCLTHEEGHRRIAERIYELSDDIAAYCANKVQSRSYLGEGGTPEQAIRDGYKCAFGELNQAYRDTVLEYAKLVTAEYDRITEHGLNPIGEDRAIELSFQRCPSTMTGLLEAKEESQLPPKQVEGEITELKKSEPSIGSLQSARPSPPSSTENGGDRKAGPSASKGVNQATRSSETGK